MGEYHYFFTERVTSYLLVAAYGVIGDAPVRGEELVMGCFQNGSLVEAYYLRTYFQLSRIPHFTALQKFKERSSGTLL